ncbi:MAG TPA: ABC transporter permease [Thermoanaerobaculia bacterium]|nr:ABC transporter permease [Thermoanaerobaculia bacterium]
MTNGVNEFLLDAEGRGQAVSRPTRPLYWSVRRELWEYRAIYLAPLIVAALGFIGFTFSAIGLAGRRRALLLAGDAEKLREGIGTPYDIVATLLFFTAMIIAFFYCIDALQSERRDRSILFWKSVPVSDLTAVLAKALIPLLILPALTFVVIVATQLLMFLWTSGLLLAHGMSPASTLTYYNVFAQSPIVLYGLAVMALWHAPLYGWLLLISAWARRWAWLWVVLPAASIAAFERMTSSTSHFGRFLAHRLIGGFENAFTFKKGGVIDSMEQLTPVKFLSAPGLWIGLLFAAGCIAAAVLLRRHREAM